MPRNIEIKAGVPDLPAIRSRAIALASAPSETLSQVDTFFDVPRGRLKVREFADGSGELIAYVRPRQTGPKESVYAKFDVKDAKALVETLGAVLSRRGTVAKRREVIIVGRTRVHLDQVEHLGSFVELEVMMTEDDLVEDGVREAHELLRVLGIPQDALVAEAYIDLLEVNGRHDSPRPAAPRVRL